MNDLSSDRKINELSDKVDALILGYKTGALVILFMFSLINVADTFSISYFRQVYQDALPGRPLPPITNFILGSQSLVTCLALVWPVLGLAAIFIPKKISTTIFFLTLLLFLVLFQIALNWLALFMPMISLVTGMSNPS